MTANFFVATIDRDRSIDAREAEDSFSRRRTFTIPIRDVTCIARLPAAPRAHDAKRLYYQSHDTTADQLSIACPDSIAHR
jgi:hypothetical protein